MNTIRNLAAAALLMLGANAHAVYIVDTGQGDNSPGGLAIYTDEYPAISFTVAMDYTINSVEFWLEMSSNPIYELTLSLHGDDGGSPGTVLQSTVFNGTGDTTPEWEGAFALNWLLTPGTYWVSLYDVGDYGLVLTDNANWSGSGAIDLALNDGDAWDPTWTGFYTPGVRIDATEVAAVPVPATLALFGLGLAGLGWSRRRK